MKHVEKATAKRLEKAANGMPEPVKLVMQACKAHGFKVIQAGSNDGMSWDVVFVPAKNSGSPAEEASDTALFFCDPDKIVSLLKTVAKKIDKMVQWDFGLADPMMLEVKKYRGAMLIGILDGSAGEEGGE